MSKKDRLILLVIIVIALVPIIINEIRIRPKINLINDVNKIINNIEKYSNDNNYFEEVVIDNGYTINNHKFKVKGSGIIFIEKDSSIFLNRNGMCVMKLPYNSKVMIQDEECPLYRMLNGIKLPVVKEESGLYENEDGYIFKGTFKNYVLYKDELWLILGFSDKSVELIKNKPISVNNKNIKELYSHLQKKYSKIIDDSNIIKNEWSIEDYDSSKQLIENAKYTSKIGILSPTKYMSSFIDKSSFLPKDMILSSEKLIANNSNISTNINDKTLSIYPIIKTKEIFKYGTGTLEDPYRVNETN